MSPNQIIHALIQNAKVFEALLNSCEPQMVHWQAKPGKWSMLEIVCHLYDEEREDFRARVDHVLHRPTEKIPPIDPEGWVQQRAYMEQSYTEKVQAFLGERMDSVRWLRTLEHPRWENCNKDHPEFGPLTASMFLNNWLAHDYLHIRQINQLKLDWLKFNSLESLIYAGG